MQPAAGAALEQIKTAQTNSAMPKHPEETSKNSDNCDLLKVPDIGKSIVDNGEKTISMIQPSSEKISWKYIYRKIY